MMIRAVDAGASGRRADPKLELAKAEDAHLARMVAQLPDPGLEGTRTVDMGNLY